MWDSKNSDTLLVAVKTSSKVKKHLSYDPAITVHVKYPKKEFAHMHKVTCTRPFVSALFVRKKSTINSLTVYL